MSDRPMRLKYLTKMKIVLCIFLLCITAVSVFGQSVELNGILGESVKFPAAVKIDGNLRYSGVTIGDVTSGRFRTLRSEKFSGRVQWDSSTGLFSLSGLREEDSGEYKVQNTDQNINAVFQLNVYINVSKPHVSVTHDEFPCTLLCAVERGTEVTLSWYREGQKKPYVSSRVASAPYLHLPKTVEKSGTYTCEAKNSVSNEKASITAHCTAPFSFSRREIVAISIAAVLIVIAVVFAILYWPVRRIILDKIEQKSIQAAVRRIILEGKQALPQDEDKQALPQDDEQALIQDAVRRIILDISERMVPPANDEDEQSLIQYAVRRIIIVKNLLDNLVPPAYDEDEQALIQDGVAMVAFPPDGNKMLALPPDAVRRIILVKKLLDNLVPPAYVREFIYRPEPPKKMTSSHPTEVPLNKATSCEVETA